MRERSVQIGDKISLICLVVLLIYACGALQDGSALVFVLLAIQRSILYCACNLNPVTRWCNISNNPKAFVLLHCFTSLFLGLGQVFSS